MRRTVAALSALLLAVPVVALSAAPPATATSDVTSRRLAGTDRYATAAVVARTDRPSATDAVLARGDDPADALAGGTLAGALDAPVLLSTRDRLSPAALDALIRLGVDTVHVVGGLAAAVSDELVREGFAVERVTGTDRYDTARRIAELCGTACDGAPALLANGTASADAASASPLAAGGPSPLLLTDRDRLPAPTRAALDGVDEVLVVGGPAVVSPAVVEEVEALGATVTRLSGGDRATTSTAVARHARDALGWSVSSVALGRGDVLADALAGGALAGPAEAPLLLTAGSTLGAAATGFLTEQRATVRRVDVLGGTGAVPDRVVRQALEAAGGAVAGCAVGGPPQSPGTPTTVTRGLSLPWGLAVLPDGSALVSERDTARIKRITPDGTTSVLGTVPGVVPGGEGGLLGLAVGPDFARDQWVYAYLTAGSENKVVRMKYDRIGTPEVATILGGIPKAGIHNGGRIAFGPDGLLYVGTGDAADTALSQDPRSLGGKVLRIRPDGSSAGNRSGTAVFSLGHRNVQGLGFDEDGRLWASELGQNTFDEVNQVVDGGNYGWPVVEGRGSDPRYRNPAHTWSTAEASPSGAVVAGGSFWVAALRGQRLWQVALDGNGGVGAVTPHFAGSYGRLRAVAQATDCSLWVLTNESDARLLRVPLG